MKENEKFEGKEMVAFFHWAVAAYSGYIGKWLYSPQ